MIIIGNTNFYQIKKKLIFINPWLEEGSIK